MFSYSFFNIGPVPGVSILNNANHQEPPVNRQLSFDAAPNHFLYF